MGGRLGIYVDDVFRVVGEGTSRRITVDRAFLLFACAVGAEFGGCTLFGRTAYDHPSDYVLPAEVELVPLPHYEDLFHLGEVVRRIPGTIRAMWRGLDEVDVVWAFGPHPFAIILAILAIIRGKVLVLGVRQDTLGYYRSRLPGRAWTPALGAIWVLDLVYRLLSRRFRTTVVGSEIAAHYGETRDSLLPITVSLVRTRDVAEGPSRRSWDGLVELITVGRIDREKNPWLTLAALRALDEAHPGQFRLTWVGRGPLGTEVRRRAQALGVAELVEFTGYVPYGPALLARYRAANAFVHVSLTEGVPQVIVEALAMGLPVVATAVGGVAALLDEGGAGLLVPPGDAPALVAAVERLAADAELRLRIASRGLEIAREHTLEAEVRRVSRFVAGQRKS